MELRQIQERLNGKIEGLRQSLGVAGLFVFGSVARNESKASSDVDMIVEFEGSASLDRYCRLKGELEALFGVPVDLVTRKAIKSSMREAINREAVRVA